MNADLQFPASGFSASSRQPRTIAWLPWLLSLAIHGVVLAGLSFMPGPDNTKIADHAVIDNVAGAPAEEEAVYLMLLDASPVRPILETPRLQPAPSAPVGPVVTPSVEIPSAKEGAAASDSGLPQATPIAQVSHRPEVPSLGPRGGQGETGGNNGATTMFFKVAAQGRAVVYVVDRSISMGLSGALAAAKRELLASLDQLPEDARFQVVVFNRQAEMLHGEGGNRWIPANAANKLWATTHLESIHAEGGTDPLPAIQLALSLRPDVIYFLTDANDFKSEDVRAVTRRNQGGTTIHVIVASWAYSDPKETPLRKLAQDNGGVYRAVSLK